MLPLAPFRGCGCQASGDRLPSYPSPFPESPPYLAAVHPPLCGLGGPTRFWAVRCHYAQPARSEGNTGRPKQTPSVCASRGLAAQQEGLLEGAKVAEGQDSKCCVSPDVGGPEDVSEHKQLFLLWRANGSGFQVGNSWGWGKACARPWHPPHYSGRAQGHQRQASGGARGGGLGNGMKREGRRG